MERDENQTVTAWVLISDAAKTLQLGQSKGIMGWVTAGTE